MPGVAWPGTGKRRGISAMNGCAETVLWGVAFLSLLLLLAGIVWAATRG